MSIALRAQGGAGGVAPGRQRQPVEYAFGNDNPGRRRADAGEPKHRLGAGHRLEAGRCARINRPPGEPPRQSVNHIGHHDHFGEPLRAPFQEQPAVPEPLAGEAPRLQMFPQAVARRVPQSQPQGGFQADAPRGQVRPGLQTAPQLTGVEPQRRRQQRRIAGRNRRRSGLTSCRRTNRSGRNRRCPVIQTTDGLGQGQPLGALHEVEHVAAGAAAEAVKLFSVGVDREAALGFLVEGADALPDPALAPENDTGGLHRVAQGVPGLEFRNSLPRTRYGVHRGVGYDHDAPPFTRGLRPRTLRRETSFPTGQRIPRTAATSSVPPSSLVGPRAAALPVPGL